MGDRERDYERQGSGENHHSSRKREKSAERGLDWVKGDREEEKARRRALEAKMMRESRESRDEEETKREGSSLEKVKKEKKSKSSKRERSQSGGGKKHKKDKHKDKEESNG